MIRVEEPSSTASMVSEVVSDVEVIALIAPDGTIRSTTRSIVPSLMMTEDDDDDKEETAATASSTLTPNVTHRMERLPSLVDEGTPALVRLQGDEDCSDSEDSTGSIQSTNATKSSTGSTPFDEPKGSSPPMPSCPEVVVVVANATTNNNNNNSTHNETSYQHSTSSHALVAHHADDGAVGPYDCLSDQFTNLFCSVVLCAQPTTTINTTAAPAVATAIAPATPPTTTASVTSYNPATSALACADEGCSAYPLPDYYDESDFGLPLFWLKVMNDAGKDDEFSISIPDRPHNRSCGAGGTKRRSKHLEGIWKTWHAPEQEETIPILERSKSLPEKLRATATTTSPVYCYHYNLDPEQEDFGYDSDPEQDYPRQRMQRGQALITSCKPLLNQAIPSFRQHRPASIDTTIKVMTPTTKALNEDSSLYDPPPPPPPPRRQNGNNNDGASPVFGFDLKDTPTKEDSKMTLGPTRRLRSGLDPFSALGPSPKDLMTPHGEMFLRTFIHEATNTKIPLIWHRRSSSTTRECITTASTAPILRPPPPMAVTCTFEVGAHLDQVVVQPKFTWCPTHEPHLDQRKIRLSGGEPHSIELLSIIRVVSPKVLNRAVYPFARLDRTLCITTNDESFEHLVLEAESTRARDWLVNALKMIVARLASIIIVRDEAMLLEFFTPFAGLMHLEEQQEAEADAAQNSHHMDVYDYPDDDDDEEFDDRNEKPSPVSTFASNGEPQLVSPTIQPKFCNGEFQLVSYATGK